MMRWSNNDTAIEARTLTKHQLEGELKASPQEHAVLCDDHPLSILDVVSKNIYQALFPFGHNAWS